MKKILRVLCVLGIMLLCACGQKDEPSAEYYLYFLPAASTSYGSALATQPWEGTGTALNEELMRDLLAGPTQEGLRSPFPKGLTLQSMEAEGNTIHITLSEHYSGLTDMAQTLADACIVMTLCQLTGITEVEISTDGFWASRPASRTLRPEQMELTSLLREGFP